MSRYGLIPVMICLCALFSCSNGSSDNFGVVESKYRVGDIVLNDGDYLRDVESLNNNEKAKAIAVIFRVDGAKAYGVGLVHNKTGLAWCLQSANAYNVRIDRIESWLSGGGKGDDDGSDNLIEISNQLGPANDDTGNSAKYPAFYFAKEYKGKNNNVVGTVYETGWYLPTLKELKYIWDSKEIVEAGLSMCGGNTFAGDFYWSSNQCSSRNDALLLYFSDGKWYANDKGKDFNYNGLSPKNNVCAIRQF